jgi:hypothetical protein
MSGCSFNALQCEVSGESLKIAHHYSEIPVLFTGSDYQKGHVFLLHFHNSDLDYLPEDLNKSFSQLGGLKLSNAPLTELKMGYLHSGMRGLKFLKISNKLKNIQKYALTELVNLEVADFYDNQIEALPYKLFDQNPKITTIEFRQNKIKSINLRFFDNIVNLEKLIITKTWCVNSNFDKAAGNIHGQLVKGLKSCYKNCIDNEVCYQESMIGSGSEFGVIHRPWAADSKIKNLVAEVDHCKEEILIYMIVIALVSFLALLSILLLCCLLVKKN